jgi:hypothetical protein
MQCVVAWLYGLSASEVDHERDALVVRRHD